MDALASLPDNLDDEMTADIQAEVADEIPAITPRSTRKSRERQFSHKMKMLGKKFDRERRAENFKPTITVMSRNEIRRRFGPNLARYNRHTGKPHEHAQEIMRRALTPAQRKTFRDNIAAGLGMGANIPEGARVVEFNGPVSSGKMLYATTPVTA